MRNIQFQNSAGIALGLRHLFVVHFDQVVLARLESHDEYGLISFHGDFELRMAGAEDNQGAAEIQRLGGRVRIERFDGAVLKGLELARKGAEPCHGHRAGISVERRHTT